MKQNFSKNLKQTLRLVELKQNTKPQLVGDALGHKQCAYRFIYLSIESISVNAQMIYTAYNYSNSNY